MKYMLNIFTDERARTDATPEQIRETMEAYGAFGKEIEDKGIYLAGEGLQPTATATTVQVRDGETIITDGPFAETREQLIGIFIISARDLNEAIQVAAQMPQARGGPIEVWSIQELDH